MEMSNVFRSFDKDQVEEAVPKPDNSAGTRRASLFCTKSVALGYSASG